MSDVNEDRREWGTKNAEMQFRAGTLEQQHQQALAEVGRLTMELEDAHRATAQEIQNRDEARREVERLREELFDEGKESCRVIYQKQQGIERLEAENARLRAALEDGTRVCRAAADYLETCEKGCLGRDSDTGHFYRDEMIARLVSLLDGLMAALGGDGGEGET